MSVCSKMGGISSSPSNPFLSPSLLCAPPPHSSTMVSPAVQSFILSFLPSKKQSAPSYLLFPSSHASFLPLFSLIETFHSRRPGSCHRCPSHITVSIAFHPCSLLLPRGTTYHEGPGLSSLLAHSLTERLWGRFVTLSAFNFFHL